MKLLQKAKASWLDLFRGSGSWKERIERNEALVLFLILLVAGAIRVLFLSHFYEELYTRREKGFWYPAWNFVHGKGLGIAEYCPTSYRAPLYFFFLIPFFFTSEWSYALPLGLAQAAFSIANVYLVYRLAKELFGSRPALFAAAFMAVYPYNLYHDTQNYPTFLFTFFLLLLTLDWLRLEKKPSCRRATFLGIWIGLAMLAQSGPLVFFAPLASFWLLWRWKDLRKTLKYVGIVAVTALIVMSPWIVRNYRVHHAFVPLSTDAGRVFYKAYNPWALYMLQNNLHVDLTPEPGEGVKTPSAGIGAQGCGFLGMTEYENDHYWYGKARTWIKENPQQVPLLMTYKFLQLWRPWLWTPKNALGDNGAVILSAAFMNWGYAISYATVLIFAGLGWLTSSREQKGRELLVILLAIAFSITYSLTYAFSKYRIPFDSVMAALAGAGIWRLLKAWFEYHKRVK